METMLKMVTSRTSCTLQNLSAQLQKAELTTQEKDIHKQDFSVVRIQIKISCFKVKMVVFSNHRMDHMLIRIITHRVDTTFLHNNSNRWNYKSSWRKFKWKDKAVHKLLVEHIIKLICRELVRMDLSWVKVLIIRLQILGEHHRSLANQRWAIKHRVLSIVDQMVETNLEAILNSSNLPTMLQHTNK